MNNGILQLISAHIGTGETNATPAEILQRLTGLDDRSLRVCVEQLRRSGCVVCSDENGYFKPATIEEVQRYIKKESRRAQSILCTLESAKQLEKVMRAAEDNEKGDISNG